MSSTRSVSPSIFSTFPSSSSLASSVSAVSVSALKPHNSLYLEENPNNKTLRKAASLISDTFYQSETRSDHKGKTQSNLGFGTKTNRKLVFDDLLDGLRNGEMTVFSASFYSTCTPKNIKQHQGRGDVSPKINPLQPKKTVVGTVCLTHHNDGSGKRNFQNAAFMQELAVKPDCRRKGIAKHLVEAATEAAAEYHPNIITATSNPATVKICRKLGYKKMPDRKVRQFQRNLPGFNKAPEPGETWTWLKKDFRAN